MVGLNLSFGGSSKATAADAASSSAAANGEQQAAVVPNRRTSLMSALKKPSTSTLSSTASSSTAPAPGSPSTSVDAQPPVSASSVSSNASTTSASGSSSKTGGLKASFRMSRNLSAPGNASGSDGAASAAAAGTSATSQPGIERRSPVLGFSAASGSSATALKEPQLGGMQEFQMVADKLRESRNSSAKGKGSSSPYTSAGTSATAPSSSSEAAAANAIVPTNLVLRNRASFNAGVAGASSSSAMPAPALGTSPGRTTLGAGNVAGTSASAAGPGPAAGGKVCRWGVIGCTPTAARFVQDLYREDSSSRTPTHRLVAISASTQPVLRDFLTANVPPRVSLSSIETYTTLTELLAHPGVDVIFVASPQQNLRGAHARSAMRAGKSVLLANPIALSAQEAWDLARLAGGGEGVADKGGELLQQPTPAKTSPATPQKGRLSGGNASAGTEAVRRWLGIVLKQAGRTGRSDRDWLWAADAAATSLAQGKVESEALAWKENIGVLEALDTVRAAGGLVIPQDESEGGSMIFSASQTGLSSASMAHVASSASSLPPVGSEGAGPGASPLIGGSSNAGEDRNRSSSRLSMASESSVGMDDGKTALRAQLQELRNVLRQKNALIASLEEKAGMSPGSSSSAGLGIVTRPRRRSGSLGGSTGEGTSRRRSIGATSPESSPRLSGNAQLTPVKEGRGASEGFLAPTKASENRRVANLLQQANGMAGNAPASPTQQPPSPGASVDGAGEKSGSSGKVIASLTKELQASREALETSRSQCRSIEHALAVAKKSLEETKSALSRSRAENEHVSGMMQRKERQVTDALERARKAESEGKELGRASREWGTRVREVEAELGEERKRKQKAESGYDAIVGAWKRTREDWRREIEELRAEVEKRRHEAKETARRWKEGLDKMQSAHEARQGESTSLEETLVKLAEERAKAEEVVRGQVRILVSRLEEHERTTKGQEDEVRGVHDELRRILRLMRAG